LNLPLDSILIFTCLFCLAGCEETRSGETGKMDAGIDAGCEDAGCEDAGGDADLDAQWDGGDGSIDDDAGDASGICEAMAELVPGEMLVGVTCKGNNDLERYACSGLDESGPDMAYSFTSKESKPVMVTATLTGLTADLDVFLLLDSCSDDACAAHSAGPAKEVVSTVLLPGQTVFVSIDGYKGTCGSFNLLLSLAPVETDCADAEDNDGDGLTDCFDSDCVWADECAEKCTPNEPISCGEVQFDSTLGQLNEIEFYAGYPIQLSGPEWIYVIDNAMAGMELGVDVVERDSQLDIVVLEDGCVSNAVVAADPEQVTFTPKPNTTYYLGVDGRDSYEGQFDIRAQCKEIDCEDNADNDGDGLLDCDDPDCELYAGCVTLCNPLFSTFCPDTGEGLIQACYFLSPEPLIGFCHAPGEIGAGKSCQMPYDCLPGHMCAPAGVCLKTCDLEFEESTCDLDSFCAPMDAGRLGVCI
jgi:hypothetical protein